MSNFWPSEVIYNGRKFRTVEHAYQAAKCVNVGDQQAIQMMERPGDAKRFGKVLGGMQRPDWKEVNLSIMEDLIRQKFSKEPLRTKLIETGDAIIVEGNYWRDTFWGVYQGHGQNHLGKIIMRIREELKSEQ